MSSKVKFNEFVDTNDEEIESLLQESKAKNTQRSTQARLKKFSSYLSLHKLPKESDLEDRELPNILTKFFTDVGSTTTAERFKTGSLKVLRAGLNRHFKITRSIDIVADEQFRRANLVFDGVQVKAKKEGKGQTVSTPHISPEDLAIIVRMRAVKTKQIKSNYSNPRVKHIVNTHVNITGVIGNANLECLK